MSELEYDSDDLIDRAKQAYRRRARRDLLHHGISWNQLPDYGWYVEEIAAGIFVACSHGGRDAARYRWTGSRLIPVSVAA